MGGNEKGYIALEDLDKLSREDLRRIVWAFEGIDISNQEDYEYGYIAFRDIDDTLSNLLENDGHIEKKQFIDRYIKVSLRTYVFVLPSLNIEKEACMVIMLFFILCCFLLYIYHPASFGFRHI